MKLWRSRRPLPGRGRACARRPPTDPYVKISLIRFVSCGPGGPKTLRVTSPQGVMTVAAHQNTRLIRGRGSASCCSTALMNFSQLIRFVEFRRPSHFLHVSRVWA